MAVTFPYVDPTGATIILQTFTFRDAKGWTAQVRFFFNENGGSLTGNTTLLQSIKTALINLTNAAYQGASGLIDEYGVKQYGISGTNYESVRQKASLAYQDAAGAIHRINVPAAKVTIFDADHQTVLPSAVAAFNALVATSTPPTQPGPGFVCNRSGIYISNYMGGFFQARGTKKNKLFFLNGALTPSEPGE